MSIVGSYRLGLCRDILERRSIERLYLSTRFDFHSLFIDILPYAVELGRSFIQQKYWRGNALELLWQGIGTFLSLRPSVRWLYGAVSISDSYSEEAKALIVHYYRKWFATSEQRANSKNPCLISKNMLKEMEGLLDSGTRKGEFIQLNMHLKALGYTVPVLFRRYVE